MSIHFFQSAKKYILLRCAKFEEDYYTRLLQLSPEQRKYSLSISEHVVKRFAWGFGWASGMIISGGRNGIVPALLFFFVYVFVGAITLGRIDRFVKATSYFLIAIFFLNIFFGDIWKTLSIPLAFLFYTLGKNECPDLIKSILNYSEKGILGRKLAESESQKPSAGIKQTQGTQKTAMRKNLLVHKRLTAKTKNPYNNSVHKRKFPPRG